MNQADGTIGDWHDADITPETIIPPWYGERLDLDYAIYTCFANAANQARQQCSEPQPAQVGQPEQAEQAEQAEQIGQAEQAEQVGQADHAEQAERYEAAGPVRWVIEPQDWMPSLRGVYTLG
jgi:hypothetical protein